MQAALRERGQGLGRVNDGFIQPEAENSDGFSPQVRALTHLRFKNLVRENRGGVSENRIHVITVFPHEAATNRRIRPALITRSHTISAFHGLFSDIVA